MSHKNLVKHGRFISTVGIAAIALGFLVTAGWLLNIPLLTTLLPGYSSMKFNTALGVVALGVIINVYARPGIVYGRQINVGLSLLVLALGAVNLLRVWFIIPFHLNAWLPYTDQASFFAGRMSPVTALCFFLLGHCLLFIKSGWQMPRRLAQYGLHIVTILSFIAAVGYLFNVPEFYYLSFLTSMALHTALAFFFVSIAASLFNPDMGIVSVFIGSKAGHFMARKMGFQLTVAVLIIGYVRIFTYRFNLVSEDFGIALFAISFVLVGMFLIWRIARQLNAIEEEKAIAQTGLERLNAILDSTPDPLIIVNAMGSILLCNSEVEKVLGYNRNELLGEPASVLLPEWVRANYAGGFFTAERAQREEDIIELFALKKDGTEIPVEISLTAATFDDNLLVTAALRDVTVRKAAEMQLNRMATIINSSADAIISKKLDGTILTWNKGAEEILGYTFAEASGKHISMLFPPELLEEEVMLINKILSNQHVDQYETERVRKDGTRLNVSITLSPVRDSAGNIVAVSKVLRDITRQKNAERELRQSELRNRIFVEQAPNALAMFDTQMRYMAASRKWKEDYGITGKEIIGHSHYDIFPEIGEDWKTIHRECLAGDINTCAEAPFYRTDGTTQWLTWDVRPWYISEGKIGGLLMYTADITHLKQKEAERNRIERILERSNQIAKIGTWEVDVATEKTQWSPMANEIFEIEPEKDPDRATALANHVPPHSMVKLMQAVNEQMQTGAAYDIELEIITGKGNHKWVRVIGEVEWANGVIKKRFGMFQDINRSKRIEQALNVANEELRAVFNSGYVSIIGTDTNGLITHFNQGAEMLLQYKAAEMVGIQTPAILHEIPEVIARAKELTELMGYPVKGFDVFVEKAKQGSFESREWTYIRKDGTQFPVQLIVSAIKDRRGEITGFIGIATDITERKATEAKLRNYSILESKSKEMEQFAYITSHDLREPLLTIKNYIQLLLEDYGKLLTDADAQFYTGQITNAAGRMEQLISGLLDYSRLSKIKQLQTVDCNQVMNDVLADLNSLITSTGATITAEPLPVLQAYPLELKLLLQNLVNNAVKFRKKDIAPVVTISAQPVEGGWQFTVADNGIGIEAKNMDKIFIMFQRLHNRDEYEGTGIGLAQCKKIAELHNGSIWVESEPGQYSKFCFTILT